MADFRKRMNDVSHLGLKCADCGVDIKELPFVPKDDRPVYCGECARKRRPPKGPRSGGFGRR